MSEITSSNPFLNPDGTVRLNDIHDLRHTAFSGEPVSDEEMRDALAAMRAERVTAKPPKTKAKSQPVSLFDLNPPE